MRTYLRTQGTRGKHGPALGSSQSGGVAFWGPGKRSGTGDGGEEAAQSSRDRMIPANAPPFSMLHLKMDGPTGAALLLGRSRRDVFVQLMKGIVLGGDQLASM